MLQKGSNWDEAVWSLPITNRLIAEMLNELLGHAGLEDSRVDLVTHVTVAPEDGLITFYFTHTNPPGRVLHLVPRDEMAARPRLVPVKGGAGGK